MILEVWLVGPAGLADGQLADAADLLGRLVAGGAALGWVAPPSPAEVRDLLGGAWNGDEGAPAPPPIGSRYAARASRSVAYSPSSRAG